MKLPVTAPATAPAQNRMSFYLMLIVLCILHILLLIVLLVGALAPTPVLIFGKFSCQTVAVMLMGGELATVLAEIIHKLINAPRPWHMRLRLLRDMPKNLLMLLRASEMFIDIYVNEKADQACDAATTILCIKLVFICARMLVMYRVSIYKGHAITFNLLNQDTLLDPFEGLAMFTLNRMRDETVSPFIVTISQGLCIGLTFVFNVMVEPLDDD